jgi:hypothetical protein
MRASGSAQQFGQLLVLVDARLLEGRFGLVAHAPGPLLALLRKDDALVDGAQRAPYGVCGALRVRGVER